MFQQYRPLAGIFFLFTLFASTGQSQIPVNGIADRGLYSGSVAFSVPATLGYSYSLLLDGKPVLPDYTNTVTQANYHELWVYRTNAATREGSSRLVRFILRAIDRATTEDGLPPWVPYPMIPSTSQEWAGARIDLVMPAAIPSGLEVPVIAWVRNAQEQVVRGNGQLVATGHPNITIRRGVGSGHLASNAPAGPLTYTARLPGLEATRTVDIEASTTWTPVSGNLAANTTWPANARMDVTADLTVAAGVTLTIGDGVVVRLAGGINITNHGRIVIAGSASRPVLFTPFSKSRPWGGFYLLTANALLEAENSIFVASGSRQTGVPGHRSEQALFYLDNRAKVYLTNCSAIDLAGQFEHTIDRGTPYSVFTAVGCLIQRCTTAGEFNGCALTFLNSALLEVPSEDQFYCADPDCDHDGLYLNTGIHEVRDSLIGWLKDDCIDAGSGGGPSTVTVSNCWLEAAYHEALAWSERGRVTRTTDSILINNGQGIEAGWTTGAPTDAPTTPISPNVTGERILCIGNGSGARFGDNYNWGYRGFLRVTNSLLLHNYRDIFAKTWNSPGQSWDTNSWVDRTNQMELRKNFLTAANPSHPDNSVWNPASDAWRIAPFMRTPPSANVGIGLANWDPITVGGLFQGVPVRLSSFTTNVVSVNYGFSSSAGTLLSGTLTFQPGETVKRIYPYGIDLPSQSALRLVLSDPVRGELTGPTEITFQGTIARPVVAFASLTSQADLARLDPGVPVMLSTPSGLEVRVDYRVASAAGTLANGTLVFAPGQTLLLVSPPGVSFADEEFLEFKLSNSVNAQLGTPSTLYLAKILVTPTPPPTALIPRGAVWKYLATGVDQGTAWRELTFTDTTWPSGPAELGFGESDQNTPIPDNNQITTYFRHSFNVPDPTAYANLPMWMLRDDGGVVYINGAEVFRSPNLPAAPAVISYGTLTGAPNGENTIDNANISPTRLRTGNNVVAVEIHQQAPDSSDVSFNFELLGESVPPPPLPQTAYLAEFDGTPRIAWGDPQFILQQADAITGPWSLASNRSPYTITPSEQQKFYRLVKP
jgi:hypothetical protein